MAESSERLTVGDLMSGKVVAVRPEDDVAEVHDLMLRHAIRHVPVVDGDERLVGLVSHRDLLRYALIEQADVPPAAQEALLRDISASDLMTEEPESVSADDGLAEAARVMLARKYGCLPVVDGDGRVIGILTESDFVRMAAEEN